MSIWDDYWKHIDNQLEELKTAKSAADVIRICPPEGAARPNAGFFGGGGGDTLPDEPLAEAGWTYAWSRAPYYWCMKSPAGDFIEYVEGDLYAYGTMPKFLP